MLTKVNTTITVFSKHSFQPAYHQVHYLIWQAHHFPLPCSQHCEHFLRVCFFCCHFFFFLPFILQTNAQGFISPAAVSVFCCFVFFCFFCYKFLPHFFMPASEAFLIRRKWPKWRCWHLLSRGRTKVTLPHKVPFFCIPFFGSNCSTSSGFFILLFICSPASCTFRCVFMYSRAMNHPLSSSISPLSWSSRLSS